MLDLSRIIEFSHGSRRVVGKAAVMALAVALIPASGTQAIASDRSGPAVFAPDETGTATAVSAEALMARATERGELRVIVGLDTGFQPEGALSETAVASQRSGIAAAQEALVGTLSAPKTVSQFETIPFVAMTVTPDDLGRLLSSPQVSTVEEDVAVPPTLNDSVPLVDTPKLWRRGIKGTGQAVAILDTGVRRNHRAFRDRGSKKIVGSACFSSNSSISTTLCPNGKEKMIRRNNGRAGVDCNTSINGCGHGTHVAGIAAGKQRGNHGMAKKSDIVPIQVFSRFGSGNCGGNPPCVRSFTSDQVKGLEKVLHWRNRLNIAAANMSLGGGQFFAPCDGSQPSRTAIIENLRSKGVATVIASGNSGFDDSVGAPACISSAVTVGSTTKTDSVSSFSNHDEMVDVLAPGSSIRSADADGPRGAQRVLSGTSMATPHVAGAVALLKSFDPTATVDQIERALECTGKPISTANLPRPRISMFDAYRELKNPSTRSRWNFSSKRQVRQWREVLGNWRKRGNTMMVQADTPNVWYIAESPFCSDEVVVNAVMSRKDPDTSENWNSGVLLSGQADDGGNFSGLWFAYAVSQSDETFVAIWEMNGYSGTSNSGRANLLCSDGPLAGRALGERRRIRAIRRGNGRLVLKIDGNTVCTATTDTRFEYGKVAVVMAAPANDPNHQLNVAKVTVNALGGDGIASFDVAGTSGAATAVTTSASGNAATGTPASIAAQ